MLIVADKLCPCFNTHRPIKPKEVIYGYKNTSKLNYCEKLKYNIYRRKPSHCFNYHPEVR